MITSIDLKNKALKRRTEKKWAEQQLDILFKKYQKKFDGSKEEMRYILQKACSRVG